MANKNKLICTMFTYKQCVFPNVLLNNVMILTSGTGNSIQDTVT